MDASILFISFFGIKIQRKHENTVGMSAAIKEYPSLMKVSDRFFSLCNCVMDDNNLSKHINIPIL
jgi:hypothetical protein